MTAGVKIASALLSASVDPLGAELCSLKDHEGRQYLFDGDPAWWAGSAPLLFPIVGGLNGGRYKLEGRDHALPRHGFARRSWFELIDRTAASARFRLTDSVATRSAYPFAFVLEVAFALAGATLTIEATVRNPGGEPLPFSFGFHPAFAWPLPGGGERLSTIASSSSARSRPRSGGSMATGCSARARPARSLAGCWRLAPRCSPPMR